MFSDPEQSAGITKVTSRSVDRVVPASKYVLHLFLPRDTREQCYFQLISVARDAWNYNRRFMQKPGAQRYDCKMFCDRRYPKFFAYVGYSEFSKSEATKLNTKKHSYMNIFCI